MILLSIPALFALVAYFYTHRLTDYYGASTQILLKSGEDLDYQSQVYSRLAGFSNYVDITNQKRVLTSYDLISKVLEKLDYDVTYYVVGRVKTIPGNSLEPVDVHLDHVQNSILGQRIDLQILDAERYELAFELGGEKVRREHYFDVSEKTEEYSIVIRKKAGFGQQDISSLISNNYQFEVNSLTAQVIKYRSKLNVENPDYSSLMEITIQDELPDRAKMFLDTLAGVYIDYTLEKQLALNENTIQYIDVQLDKVSGILDSIETDMEVYKASNAILDLSKEEDHYFHELVRYESMKRGVELKLDALGSLENYLLTNKDHNLIPPSSYVVDDEFLDKTLNELYQTQLDIDKNLFDVTEGNVTVIRTEQRIDSIRKNLLLYVNNSRSALRDQIQGINRNIADYESKIREIPGSERDLIEINRKLSVNEKMYVFLLEKRANTVIAKAAIIPQTSVIEKARSIGMVAPDKQQIILTFLGIGVLLALLISFFRFLFYERIENVRELKEATSIPVLGGIPLAPEANESRLVVNLAPKSSIAESFRSIRTSIQYINPDKEVKAMLVTSLHPGEGKTFCSANIATIFAKAGKKVVLLDFDLHKPKVHKTFGLDNDIGLSTYLIGNAEWSSTLQETDIKDLFVISSGPLPPNPSELVLSSRVEQLISDLKGIYDLVIVDTPPLLLISDAMVLRQHSDVEIFVMNTKVTSKQGLRYLEEIIEGNSMNNSSILLNGIKRSKWSYYTNKYTYGYGYGYGYGQGYGSS